MTIFCLTDSRVLSKIMSVILIYLLINSFSQRHLCQPARILWFFKDFLLNNKQTCCYSAVAVSYSSHQQLVFWERRRALISLLCNCLKLHYFVLIRLLFQFFLESKWSKMFISDPDRDPAPIQSFGSLRIRIRNTAQQATGQLQFPSTGSVAEASKYHLECWNVSSYHGQLITVAFMRLN